MAKYLLRVPVSGDEYYVVEADTVEEAIKLANEDPWDLPTLWKLMFAMMVSLSCKMLLSLVRMTKGGVLRC